jgi:DNA-binding XRE family transcriptional regulator
VDGAVTAFFPVHPDDVTQLIKIRRYLIGFRHTNGWSQVFLSRLINGTDSIVYDLETNPTWQWRLSRLQSWVLPFDLRLSAQFKFDDDPDLEQRVQSHPEVAPMLALSHTRGAWPKWQRIYLTSSLTVARRELGISTQQLGERLGIGRKAINSWEAGADEVMLPKLLRHARILGGRIEFALEEEDHDAQDEDPCHSDD